MESEGLTGSALTAALRSVERVHRMGTLPPKSPGSRRPSGGGRGPSRGRNHAAPLSDVTSPVGGAAGRWGGALLASI